MRLYLLAHPEMCLYMLAHPEVCLYMLAHQSYVPTYSRDVLEGKKCAYICWHIKNVPIYVGTSVGTSGICAYILYTCTRGKAMRLYL